MEVVNTDTFELTEHLVGQQNQTLSFGVSSDPALMAMLSTGLYTYPHRTMIQELLFNAWDAHKMNGATDTPIDVYINETSGLIVRDYGPGIEPGEGDTNIHGTYCIYGYSSKRKDKNMTGGFGLGTKAPFAYTESFSVTSFYGGVKNMYLIRRVAEDQEGRPGFTPLMKVPSTETGLMVVIPLKKYDEHRTRIVVRDIAYLSGLKINIHFEQEPVEEIRAKTIDVGEFHIAENEEIQQNNVYLKNQAKVFAVYGGVRYEIPKDDFYVEELNFIWNVLKDDQRIFIGFAPNSLTPTPNRENLNLNEKTKETIKQVFEAFYERFQEIVEPLAKTYIQVAMTRIAEVTKNPLYAFYRAMLIGSEQEKLDLSYLFEAAQGIAPVDSMDRSIWSLGLRLVNKYTEGYVAQLKNTNWYLEICKAYAMLFPEDVGYVTKWREINKDNKFFKPNYRPRHLIDETTAQRVMHMICNHQTFVELQSIINEWNQGKNHPMIPRVWIRENWTPITFNRPYHDIKERYPSNNKKNRFGKRKHRPSAFDKYFWVEDKRNKDVFRNKDDGFIVPRTIILSKTLEMLEEVRLDPIKASLVTITDPKTEGEKDYRCPRLVTNQSIPAIVVHELHGAYAKAKKLFESRGYTIWEAPDPERKARVTPTVKVVKPEGFRILPLQLSNWVPAKGYVPKPEEVITDPEYYLYRTAWDLRQYSEKANPNGFVLEEWMKVYPKTVIINNSIHEKKLQSSGVRNMETLLDAFCRSWFKDEKRFRTAVLLEYLETAFKLPLEMLNSPAIRKEFNIPIPDKVKVESFKEDIARLNYVAGSSSPLLKKSSFWVKMNKDFMAPDKGFIGQKNHQFQVFDLSRIGDLFKTIPPQDQEAFIKKVIKMTKSF